MIILDSIPIWAKLILIIFGIIASYFMIKYWE